MSYYDIKTRAESWLNPEFDKETQARIKELLEKDPDELKESFYKDLEFGTGGMRGIMGVGTNRINKYTLGKNTQGLSNYLKRQFPEEDIKVVIAYDCRQNSRELAQVVANVFSANGIKVFLFSELRPTPELSFSVKHLNCHCGIVLTASHNPPEYNGYKVYWQDGGQLVPPQDKEIVEEIASLQYSEVKFEANKDLIELIDTEVDKAFVEASVKNGSFDTPQEAKDNLNIVFTSLHGTAIKLNPKVLEAAGYKNVNIVKEQAEPDGTFPTVASPNPEEPAALKMALEKAKEINADIVIGTDPDGDRLGVAVKNLKGEMELLNGNQTMLVMTWFLLEQWKKQDKIKGREFVGCTIVSTPMMRVVTESYGVQYKEGLTGFKWIAKMIKDNPGLNYIGGGEESFGFMVGDFVRDKDAATSTLLACEIAAQMKANGISFYEKLLELYKEFGFYKEELISLVKKGIDGAEQIKNMMVSLRDNPLSEINGEKVVLVEDYESSKAFHYDLTDTRIETLDIPKSNVLIYYTENGTKVAARPSGTEPKIKFYISVNAPLENISEFEKVEQELSEKIAAVKSDLKLA
ncbi:phospho-sugar mutase [Salinimicrobium tongyeongense]|jgi:phosphomannomutase|uniref:Phospho-sugar mutase n=1 Tax=Salinimicrobium tongyeongense TaxID=2809707 RepID=A0ABY6NNR4_9FLAO|nr:phospho-sugar mutase [Salinimicrobium tongyeongense]UZH54527.1 phospho-sugar mutase [Salinimicrobium tongyeongense]